MWISCQETRWIEFLSWKECKIWNWPWSRRTILSQNRFLNKIHTGVSWLICSKAWKYRRFTHSGGKEQLFTMATIYGKVILQNSIFWCNYAAAPAWQTLFCMNNQTLVEKSRMWSSHLISQAKDSLLKKKRKNLHVCSWYTHRFFSTGSWPELAIFCLFSSCILLIKEHRAAFYFNSNCENGKATLTACGNTPSAEYPS